MPSRATHPMIDHRRRWSQLPGRTRRRLTEMVFAAKGDRCWRCGAFATTVDHIVPDSAGGLHTVTNLRPACKSCNSSRQDTASGDGRYGATVIVLTGVVPADYLDRNAEPGDLVVDLGRIAAALAILGGQTLDTLPAWVRHVAIGARAEAVRRAARLREPVTVWVTHQLPTPAQVAQYRRDGWTVITFPAEPGPPAAPSRAW